MTIKNDRWIREQCMAPQFVINRYIPQAPNPHCDMYLKPVVQKEFSWQTEEAIEREISRDRFSDAGVKNYRRFDPSIDNWQPMIEPFVSGQVRVANVRSLSFPDEPDVIVDVNIKRQKIVSYGTSSFGYDVRLGRKFKIFTNINSGVIDPLEMDDKCYVDFEGDTCIIPPNSYVLGHTIETFNIPRDVMVICLGKSTYARCGAIVNTTPIEAGFSGQVVIEISNATNLPLKIHANQGIAQFLFFQSDEPCETSYADRGGKYQNQRGITTAKV